MNALHSPTRRGLQPGPHSRLSTPMRLALRCAAGVALSTALSTALALKVDMYAIGNWSGGNCTPGNTDNDRGSWPGMPPRDTSTKASAISTIINLTV